MTTRGYKAQKQHAQSKCIERNSESLDKNREIAYSPKIVPRPETQVPMSKLHSTAQAPPRRGSSFSMVLLLAQDQMAKQNAILFTKSARLYTKFRASSFTWPSM
jgi:hypothetical protein